MPHSTRRSPYFRTRLALVLVLMAMPSMTHATARLENIPPQPHGAPAGSSLESIRDSVIQGAAEAGWHALTTAPGEVTVSTEVRSKHEATVSIRFDESTFQIDYVDSVNLDYDPDGGLRAIGRQRNRPRIPVPDPGPRIHKNYNIWVQSLAERVARRIVNPLPLTARSPQPGIPMIADELEKLDALRSKGILSDEEFDQQKDKLLAH